MSDEADGRASDRIFGRFGAKFTIFPGESASEFELLYERLAEELMPDGPIEEDLVLTVAKCTWRKQRKQRFSAASALEALVDKNHPAYDEGYALHAFHSILSVLRREPEVERALAGLSEDAAHHLRTTTPREQFPSFETWIEAMRDEEERALLPTAVALESAGNVKFITHAAKMLPD